MFAWGGAVSGVPVRFCLDNVRFHSLNCPSLVHGCLLNDTHSAVPPTFRHLEALFVLGPSLEWQVIRHTCVIPACGPSDMAAAVLSK